MIDLGLRLDQCLAMALQDEEAPPLPARTDHAKVAQTLEDHGATPAEIAFLLELRRRVELNAMTSDQFLAWLEAGLSRHGAGKVVPPAEVLELAWRRTVARRLAAGAVQAAMVEGWAVAAALPAPAGLGEDLQRAIADSHLAWDEALAALVSRSGPEESAW